MQKNVKKMIFVAKSVFFDYLCSRLLTFIPSHGKEVPSETEGLPEAIWQNMFVMYAVMSMTQQ